MFLTSQQSKKPTTVMLTLFASGLLSTAPATAQVVRYPKCEYVTSTFTPYNAEPCNGCATAPFFPDDAKVKATQEAARDEVRNAVESGRINGSSAVCWNLLPYVQFVSCDFKVGNASWWDGTQYRYGPTCAAGMSDGAAMKIVVSTRRPDEVYALVRWETINVYLLRIGRDDLTDRWVSDYADPKPATLRIRRRSVSTHGEAEGASDSSSLGVGEAWNSLRSVPLPSSPYEPF